MTVRWRTRAARAGIGVLAVTVLFHVAVLIPRIAPLAHSLPERLRPTVWAVVLTVVTAVAACLLALVLLWRAGGRPGVPVLASFLCFLAAFWGSLLRFLSVTVEANSVNASLTFGGIAGFLATTALLASVASFVHLSSTFPRQLTAADLGVDPPDVLGLVWAVLLVAAPTVVVLTTAIAVFFAGAFDPGLILRRSTIWGFAGAVGLLMFAGLENALSEWVEARLAFPGMLGAIAAGGLAAGVMIPVRALMSRVAGGAGAEGGQ
ncbi:MAG: hypothetical protein PVH00_05030 [Gemmatimonadota bacterium]